MDQLEKYLKALLLLELDAREEKATITSVLLSRAGFSNPEIGQLLNKSAGAVKMASRRARLRSKKTK